RCIRRSASWRHLPKRRRSADWPTGMRSWRCSAGRWECRSRTPRSSRAISIADKLGEFIEQHFLEAAPVDAKLRQIDFGSFIADWLRDRKRSNDLARFVLRLLPEAFSATETSGLMNFITRRITTQLQSIDLAPLAAGTLRAFVADGRHQGLLDDILRALHQSLTQPETMALIRAKVRGELPTLLRLYRTDRFLVNKIVASATAFFED